jgi:60S ribosomal subunit assembly/export protein LOC1
VQKPPNRKKGKQFVDDGQGMRTILAMVMAEKEGNIESKMMRARQMEEIREARRAEAEKRAEGKKAGLEERKEEIRQGRKKGRKVGSAALGGGAEGGAEVVRAKKKKVSFG